MPAGYDDRIFSTGPASGYDSSIFSSPPIEVDPAPEPPKGAGSVAMDTGNAFATGFWRGATRIAGLPVDTMANVLDLGKAALGAPYTAITGKPAPEWLEVHDRSKTIGSGDWLLDQARRTPGGQLMVDPRNPEYEGGYIQAAGGGSSAAFAPGSAVQVLGRAALGSGSALAGQAGYQASGSPAVAITASLLPGGIQQAVGGGLKRAVRGGEEGRRRMEQRVADLKAAGIDEPTLGLASGNRFIGGVENLLQNTPGATGVMAKARDAAISGLQAKAALAADLASPVRGASVSGMAIRQDLRGPLKEHINTGFDRLNDRFVRLVPSDQPFQIPGTLSALQRATAVNPMAPQTTAGLVQPRLRTLQENVLADSGGPGGPGLPVPAIRDIRTSIGKEAASNAIVGTPEQAQLKTLYGGLSEDLHGAARVTDMRVGPQPNNMGPAERSLSRANDFYSAGMQRIDRVQPFANKDAPPEQAFLALARSTREHVSTLQAVKKSVTPETRSIVASTVVDRLGKATPGAQNELSDVFSSERFLTNWNAMTPKARSELFSGFKNADVVRSDVEAIARAASMMRDNSRMWANPSGTAGATTARAMLLGGAALSPLSPWAPVAVGGALGTNYVAAKLATSPRTVGYFAWPTRLTGGPVPTSVRMLLGQGLLAPREPQEPGLLDALLAK